MDGLFIMTAVFFSVLVLSLQLSGMSKELTRRLDAQDDQLARIAERVGVPAPRVRVLPDVLDALARGKKIEAVKLYRDATGTGLKEAKQAVDAIEASGTQDRRA